MTFKKPTSNDNKSDKLISTRIILSQIESQMVTRVVPLKIHKLNASKNSIFITLEDPSRFKFRDIYTVFLGKIPKDNSIYTISFEFFARGVEREQVYRQLCTLSSDPQLYEKLLKTYIYVVEMYEYSYLEKFEIRIVYLCERSQKILTYKMKSIYEV